MLTALSPTPHSLPLRWADRLYQAALFVRDTTQYDAREALDAYRHVEQKFGSSPTLRIRQGRLLLLLGHYREAAHEFEKVSPDERRAALESEA